MQQSCLTALIGVADAHKQRPGHANEVIVLIKRMDKNKAIIRIGKHLLSRIKYVLTKREKYEPCVV